MYILSVIKNTLIAKMLRKIVGSSITVLVILVLVLIGPINFKDPAKTLTQTNAWGYGTGHYGGGGGGGIVSGWPSSGGAPAGAVATPTTEGAPANATTIEAGTPPANQATPSGLGGITGAVVGPPGQGINIFSTIGNFFHSVWSWISGLFS